MSKCNACGTVLNSMRYCRKCRTKEPEDVGEFDVADLPLPLRPPDFDFNAGSHSSHSDSSSDSGSSGDCGGGDGGGD